MSDCDTTSGTIRKPDVGYCAAAADGLKCCIGRPCEPAALGRHDNVLQSAEHI
jgi:hypothetical protein